jgi:hypothetical protein
MELRKGKQSMKIQYSINAQIKYFNGDKMKIDKKKSLQMYMDKELFQAASNLKK